MVPAAAALIAFACALCACSGAIGGTDPAAEDAATNDDGIATTDDAASENGDGCSGRPDGTYCGAKIAVDAQSLVTCASGVIAKSETCADGCYARTADGHDDVCGSDAVDPCFNDPDGEYCGATIGGDATKLYHCKDKRSAKVDTCPDGCADLAGATDQCNSDAVDPCFNDGDGAYCGDVIGGPAGKVYHCKDKKTASIEDCSDGCQKNPPGVPDTCAGVISCSNVQWWNVALTYGPYMSYGWWDTDLAVSHDTPVILRHASKLDKHGIYGWGFMPEFTDQVTGKRFRYLHLRPQADKMLATEDGKIYPAGFVVGFSGGDTADTGKPTYSTGAHLCVQTLDPYRDCFPTGKDACK
ncbi:MAG: hypothetical protein ACXVEE_26275 [Polyangiales bacterium]